MSSAQYPPPSQQPQQVQYVLVNQQPVTRKKGKGLGVSSLALGIIAVVFSFVPFINIISALLAILSLVFGVISIVLARGKGGAKGYGIAGTILSILSMLIFLSVYMPLSALISGESITAESIVDYTLGTRDEIDPDSSPAQDSSPLIAPIGTPVESNEFSLTVNSCYETTHIEASDGDYFYYESDAGNKYVVVNISLTNQGNSMKSLSASDFQLFTADSTIQYSPTVLISTESDDYFTFESLNPGTSITGNITFEIPETVVVSELYLRFNKFLSSDSAEFSLVS